MFSQKQLEEKMARGSLDEKMRALQEQFEALKQALAELFNEIAKNRKESLLPREFLNADALKNLPADRISEALRRIQEAINSGDADKAYAEMLKLRDLMDQMYAALNSAADEFLAESTRRQMAAMQKALSKLEHLIERQTKLNTRGDELLGELGNDLKRYLEVPHQGNMGEMANEEGGLLEKLEAMAAGLKGMLEGMGKAGEGMCENLDGAQSGLGSAFNRMSRYNLPAAMPSAKSGLYHMMRLKEGLGQAMMQMKQGASMCMMPYGLSPRRGRFREGRMGITEGDVEMDQDKNKLGRMREMIKEAIQEEGPEAYERENKKYYEDLGN